VSERARPADRLRRATRQRPVGGGVGPQLERYGEHLVASIERELGESGRVLVRYSGTEAKARVMIEGPDEAAIRVRAEEVAAELARCCRAG
jgi:phosphomannomutase